MNFKNPKLTLFAFHLRNNFTQEEPVEDADFLWKQCHKLGEDLNIPRLKSLGDRLYKENGKIGVNPDSPNSDYLELLQSEPLLNFSAIPNGSKLQIRGEIYPLQIHDTYGIDITFRFPDSQVQLEQLQHLNPQGCLQLQHSVSHLGQTLVFFAKPDSNVEDIKALADNCLTSILPENVRQQYNFSAQGEFLGSPIIEYKPINNNSGSFNYILIWLNCSSKTEDLEESGRYYQPLINLLCCHSKIDYVYTQSRRCNQKARSSHKELAAELENFHQLPAEQEKRLQQLKTELLTLPQKALDYMGFVRDLELHRITIETNNKNSQFWLKQLEVIALPEDNLEFWQKLTKNSRLLFIEQIKTDLAYLQPNQSLFQQTIDTIRGMV